MTRISLKEQYDNSSVIKQIADLTDQIDGYDEEIEQAVSTANEASSAASSAKSVADAAATKNTEQDSRLDAIEATDTAQEQEIAGIKLKDSQQDASISAIEAKDTEQDSRLTVIESKDSEQDVKIATIQVKDAEQDLSISAILDTDTKQDAAISALQTIANTLTNEVINSVSVTDGTQNGAIMVRLADVGGRVISSPNYPWGQVATFALKQGAQAGYVYGELTLSDGEVIKSNDYQILQVIESDVYVTSITLTPYPTTGKLGGEIGYSNGNTAQINVIDVPTAPGVTSNINDLLSRMGVAEASINELDTRVKAIEDTPGVGAFTNTSRGTILGSTEDGKVSANDDGTGSVSGWSDVVKSAQISDMLTKTAAASTYLTKTDAAAAYETLEGAEQISVVANEAKSTAEDANSKANGCFNSVAVNTAGDGLSFGTPSGATTDVTIPTPKISVYSAKQTTDSFTLTTTQYTTKYIMPTYNVIQNGKSNNLGGITVLTADWSHVADIVFNSSQNLKAYYGIFTNTARNSLAAQLISGLSLSDGTYILKYIPAVFSTSIYGQQVCEGMMKIIISDGEIITVSTVFTYSTSTKIDIYGINLVTTTAYILSEINQIE